jgi:hypothetical protein
MVKLEKAISLLGSSPICDIPLNSSFVAPIHLQILFSLDLPTSCRLVNLAGMVNIMREVNDQPLANYQRIDIQDGDVLHIGPFSIQFHSPLATTPVHATPSFQAALTFPRAVLQPGSTLTGALRVTNSGPNPACQLKVVINGLEPECWQIAPLPRLHSGEHHETALHLLHRNLAPLAGFLTMDVVVTAPEDYPGEAAVIQQGVYVSPVFAQSLDISDDSASGQRETERPA